ncbi:mechanosensitive ion channel family protein [Massilia yuzhufengensis]|uniref:Small-conductance mechanosensitive channel n=1 Tax=Massilia yuzhufengensis TaxID=1164594 RepID=A0A1I1PWX2_9BURK|nr:mechanosensitive ion channel family protein [Massilia yuzhufengensis]SFD14237.1 Small-conductance mechanosensitive channel [Massilia yuzhufengensis]
MLKYSLLGNDLYAWAIALAIALAVSALLYLARRVLVRRLSVFAATTTTYLDDLAVKVLSATHPLFILLMGMYAGSHWLLLSDKGTTLLARLAIAALLLQVARWGDVGVHGWLQHYRTRRSALDVASTTSTAALGFVARTAIWAIVILMILDNFGVNITTLVASLGIGGIAVALALQNVLGDLFSSLSIVLDKPFEVGDFISVDGIAGTVEYVGLKTTRIRGLGGEQVVFSNSDLLGSRIHNFKRMQTRRIVFGIGVTYELDRRQLGAIPGILREAVQAQPQARFDRAHFKSYGASSIDFETVYIMQTSDYAAYMDVQQAINLALFERFAEEGIDFAYPTQTLYLARARAGAAQEG